MQTKLAIEGASCQHCVKTIETALNELAGVESAHMDLANQLATVEGSAELAAMIETLEAKGFGASAINA